MSAPPISVVIAVRNGEKYLVAALDSIAAQGIDGIEVIVVDDGSTDGSAMIAANHRLLPVVVSRDHRGSPASLNEGMRLAAGDFLAFLDGDDVWPPDRLRAMLAEFERDPSLDCVFGQVVNTGPDLRPIGRPGPVRLPTSMLIRRESARAIGDFRTDIAHGSNVDWISRAFAGGLKYAAIEAMVLLRRMHGDNLGIRDRDRARQDMLQVVRDHLSRTRK